MAVKTADFKPSWWLRSAHLQTLWPVFFKKKHRLDLLVEQVELDDGDFIDLYWSQKDSDKTVLVLHGLEGSLDSHYANGIIYQLEQSGYKPVFMYFRGCSGRVNRLARAYHSGETGDLSAIVEHIKNKTAHYPYAVVGFSLGANVLLKWLGETGETKDGYAKALSQEQLDKQREVMAKHCAQSDVVITTAQVFGRKAPIIITSDMIKGMKPGSLVVDLAVETGGNVEGSKLGEEVEIDGVRIIGLENLPGHVAVHASQMYSSNLGSLLLEFWDDESKSFTLDLEDEIIKGCLVTHQGNIFSETVKNIIK